MDHEQHGESELESAIEHFHAKHGQTDSAVESLVAAVKAAYASGVSEYALIRLTKLTPETIADWLSDGSSPESDEPITPPL